MGRIDRPCGGTGRDRFGHASATGLSGHASGTVEILISRCPSAIAAYARAIMKTLPEHARRNGRCGSGPLSRSHAIPFLPPSSHALLRSMCSLAGPLAGAWLTAIPCHKASSRHKPACPNPKPWTVSVTMPSFDRGQACWPDGPGRRSRRRGRATAVACTGSPMPVAGVPAHGRRRFDLVVYDTMTGALCSDATRRDRSPESMRWTEPD